MIDNFEDAKTGGTTIGSGHYGRVRVGMNPGRVESIQKGETEKIIFLNPSPKHSTGMVYLTLEEATQLVKELSERIVYSDDVINGRLDK